MTFRNFTVALFTCFLAGANAQSPKHTVVGTWKYGAEGTRVSSSTGKPERSGYTLTMKFGNKGEAYERMHMGVAPAKEDMQFWGTYKLKGALMTVSYTKNYIGPFTSQIPFFEALVKKLMRPRKLRLSWSPTGELELADGRGIRRYTRVGP